jgi:hypothetical protein
MAALARAFKITEIEENPELIKGATKACFGCDLDNPKRVDRSACKTCGGTGEEAISAAEIANELKASKKLPTSEKQAARGKGGGRKRALKSVEDDSDLYLEY